MNEKDHVLRVPNDLATCMHGEGMHSLFYKATPKEAYGEEVGRILKKINGNHSSCRLHFAEDFRFFTKIPGILNDCMRGIPVWIGP